MSTQKGSIAITIERAFLRTLIPFMHIVFLQQHLKRAMVNTKKGPIAIAIDMFFENPNFGERWKNLTPPKSMAPIV